MKKADTILYWTPRILSILFICFLTFFSLDVFEAGKSPGEVAAGLLLHNIPSFLMTGLLILVCWRRKHLSHQNRPNIYHKGGTE